MRATHPAHHHGPDTRVPKPGSEHMRVSLPPHERIWPRRRIQRQLDACAIHPSSSRSSARAFARKIHCQHKIKTQKMLVATTGKPVKSCYRGGCIENITRGRGPAHLRHEHKHNCDTGSHQSRTSQLSSRKAPTCLFADAPVNGAADGLLRREPQLRESECDAHTHLH